MLSTFSSSLLLPAQSFLNMILPDFLRADMGLLQPRTFRSGTLPLLLCCPPNEVFYSVRSFLFFEHFNELIARIALSERFDKVVAYVILRLLRIFAMRKAFPLYQVSSRTIFLWPNSKYFLDSLDIVRLVNSDWFVSRIVVSGKWA